MSVMISTTVPLADKPDANNNRNVNSTSDNGNSSSSSSISIPKTTSKTIDSPRGTIPLDKLLVLSQRPHSANDIALSSDSASIGSGSHDSATSNSSSAGLELVNDDVEDEEAHHGGGVEASRHCLSPIGRMHRIHRVVLTGGPCAGKTTSINRIRHFFENIGWKAFCVPETATVLLGSGIKFYELGDHTIDFQENLLKTLLQIEDTVNKAVKFYHETRKQNCIVIYDRGAMDPVAYLSEQNWQTLKQRNPSWNEVDLRDNRYDQIVHLVSAAIGAESYYMSDNMVRTESIEVARELDGKCAKAWIGHPYFDLIENHAQFEMKIARVLQIVCERIGLQFRGFDVGNRKRKFLVEVVPDASEFPANYQDFNVIHNYLVSNTKKVQARIRKRGQSNVWSYTYTVRIRKSDQIVETRRQIDGREYAILHKTADPAHHTIYKLRRCFDWSHRYFQLDIYEEPCNPCCRGLAILTTYSIDDDLVLPSFLQCVKEITDDPAYSMFNLSMKKQSAPIATILRTQQ